MFISKKRLREIEAKITALNARVRAVERTETVAELLGLGYLAEQPPAKKDEVKLDENKRGKSKPG